MSSSSEGTRKDLVSETFGDKMRTWRRNLKSRLPYVRRREFNIVDKRQTSLIDALNLRSCASDAVPLAQLKGGSQNLGGEVCLFVTHASRPTLKRHVLLHVEHLLNAGIQVVLIVNTDLAPDSIQLDDSLLQRLGNAYVRSNRGFDFAAWSHAWKVLQGLPGCTRLYLINDSVVGPFDGTNFLKIISRVRASRADVVGLTESPDPQLHLQSYFLVVQGHALRSSLFEQFFGHLLCLPTKDLVITLYETRLTGYFMESGLTCEALFAGPSAGGYTHDDARFRWAELIRDGFPYVKASVLKERSKDHRMAQLVPADLRHIEA